MPKIDDVSKREIIKRIYNEKIKKTHEKLTLCDEILYTYKELLPIQCSTSFRDALFHLLKMNETDDEKIMTEQSFVIGEHLAKAESYAIGATLQYFSKATKVLLNEKNKKDSIDYDEMCRLIHNLKSMYLKIRINDLVISTDEAFYINRDEVYNAFEKLELLLTESFGSKDSSILSKI